MSAMAFQITGVLFVCSPICSGTDQIKLQSPASLAFVRGIHRYPMDSTQKGPVTRKMFPFDDVTMYVGTEEKNIRSLFNSSEIWHVSSPVLLCCQYYVAELLRLSPFCCNILKNYVHFIAADALIPHDNKSGLGMVLTLWGKRFLIFHAEEFKSNELCVCRWII